MAEPTVTRKTISTATAAAQSAPISPSPRPSARQCKVPSAYITAWLAWVKATAAMKSAKVGCMTSRAISPRSGGIWPRTLRAPGWRSARARTAARPMTTNQSAIQAPVRAITAPAARLATRKPSEPMPRAWA